MVPIRTIVSRTSGIAATALSSACSRSITGLGAAAGAQIIVQPTASKPGTPDSAIVGTSGNAGTRVVELTPSAHPAGVDLGDHAARIGKHERNVTRYDVAERGRRAAIGDAVHLRPGHALEQFGEKMAAPAPLWPKVISPGFCLSNAINSETDFAGTLGWTTSASGVRNRAQPPADP